MKNKIYIQKISWKLLIKIIIIIFLTWYRQKLEILKLSKIKMQPRKIKCKNIIKWNKVTIRIWFCKQIKTQIKMIN